VTFDESARMNELIEENKMLWERNSALLKTLALTQRISETRRAERNALLQRLGEPVPA
jgi:hypothetical protein